MFLEKFYPILLRQKRMLTHDIMELQFERPVGFSFLAGQFVQFQIPHRDSQVLRSYSISSSPQQPYLEFCTKILPEGKASTFFEKLVVDEPASIDKPQGVFVMRSEHHCRDKIFVATGTGLAPIASMVRSLLDRPEEEGAILLLFGVRSETDLFWMDRLERWHREQPKRFRYILTLSQPSSSWQGNCGRVTDHAAQLVGQEKEYYICGSVEMVKDIRSALIQSKLNPKRIHFEIF